MLKIIRQFTWHEGLFSIKSFVAAMLALFIAFHLNLSQPSWCITTVYIVSQPLAGMVLAKSFYRVLGTLIGAAMSLLFVALFSNSRELFCLVLALWIGLGVFVSIYLRDAPKAYAGMLAGYSAAIIGLPAVLAPDAAFDYAVARCLEIMLGIACATFMHHVVFPRRAGEALHRALDATLPTMARWADDALRGRESEAKGLADRRQIITAVVSLDSLRLFAALDTPAVKALDRVIRQYQGKLLSLLALLVSVYDRLALLRRVRPASAEALRPLLERVAAYLAASAHATTPEHAQQDIPDEAALLADIDAHLPSEHALRQDPQIFLVRSILLRVRDLLAAWHEAVWIRSHIAVGLSPPITDGAPAIRPYRDVMFALIGGAIAAVTVLVASVFWIATAWPNGPTAVTFAAIMCAVMGARDDPAAAAMTFLKMSVVGSVIAGLYLFVVLPTLTTFPALVVALAPFYLVCGLFLAVQAAIPYTLPMILIAGALINISNQMSYDFAAFMNSFFGYLVGIGIGALALRLLRPLSAEWAVQRLTRGIMADLARTAAGGSAPEERSAFGSRMFDRINALLVRLDPMIAEQRAAMQGSLASLRVGFNMLTLRALSPNMPPAAAAAVRTALTALAEHFGQYGRRSRASTPLPVLAAARERILFQGEDAQLTRIAEALYSIETTLAQHSDFFGLPALAYPIAATEPAMA